MANQQLVDYIRSQLAVGVTKEDLRKAITDAGWASGDSQAAFDVIEGRTPAMPLPRPAVPVQQPTRIQPRLSVRRSRAWVWILVAVVILVIIAGVFYFVPSLRATVGLGGATATATSTATLIAVQEPVVAATSTAATSTAATSTTSVATSTSTTTP